MFLYHFKNKKTKVKKKAENIYIAIIKLSREYIIELKYPINNNFKITFEIFSLFLIMFLKISKDLDYKKFENINLELMSIFTKDLENYFRELGIGDMSIGKYVKTYIKKFYYRIKKLDHIFQYKNKVDIIDFLSILEDQKLIEDISKTIFMRYSSLKNEIKNNKIGHYSIEL